MVTRVGQIVVIFMGFLTMSMSVQSSNNRIVAEHFFSEDTDDAEYKKYLIGYDRLFEHSQFVGFRVGTRNYHEDFATEEKNFDELTLLGRVNAGPTFYSRASLTLLAGEDEWDPVLFGLNAVFQPDESWRLEAYIERELIDSIAAINDENSFIVGGMVVDYAFLQEFTLVAGVSQQQFKDDNRKKGWLAQFLYSPGWFKGFTAKLEARESSADFNPPEYFAPDSHEQYFIILRYITALDNNKLWWLRLEGGPGRQTIDDVDESAAKYRIDLEGPITQSFNLDLYYGCTSDGGEDHYEYCYGGAELHYLW